MQKRSCGRRHPLSLLSVLIITTTLFLTGGCGTLTGIPAHGGGKRFATEQRLVSASIRSALKKIDVSPIAGKRTAIVFDLVSDEGAGNMSGGRINLGSALSLGTVVSPATTSSSAFQIFELADTTNSYTNNGAQGESMAATVTMTNGTSNEQTAIQGSTTGNSTTIGPSRAQSATSTSQAEHNEQTNSTETSTNKSTTEQASRSESLSNTTGHSNSVRQEISPNPSKTTTKNNGSSRESSASLVYRGLGEYQNFNVPKSDASLLMGLVRNYLLLNGIIPTTPTDEDAEALLYVTVDIFGTVRSRFDAFFYNNERVKAETSFEMMAFDRTGKLIMAPRNSNDVAEYTEHYLFWAGPLNTREKVYDGEGLLVDFSDVTSQPVRSEEQKKNVNKKVVDHIWGAN